METSHRKVPPTDGFDLHAGRTFAARESGPQRLINFAGRTFAARVSGPQRLINFGAGLIIRPRGLSQWSTSVKNTERLLRP